MDESAMPYSSTCLSIHPERSVTGKRNFPGFYLLVIVKPGPRRCADLLTWGVGVFRSLFLAALLVTFAVFVPASRAEPLSGKQVRDVPAIQHEQFIELILHGDPVYAEGFFADLEKNWSADYIPAVLETIHFSRSVMIRTRLVALLAEKTGIDNLDDMPRWYQWLWHQPDRQWPDYGEFKASLYQRIDPAFEVYFRNRAASARIRLDEIVWGGVKQDGIPPLRYPTMLDADQADYLEDDNIVFGVAIDGDVRAYPKRILAWHEMFIDTFGKGENQQTIAGVYCTLCGAVIIYKTEHAGVNHQLGTSGFLVVVTTLKCSRAIP